MPPGCDGTGPTGALIGAEGAGRIGCEGGGCGADRIGPPARRLLELHSNVANMNAFACFYLFIFENGEHVEAGKRSGDSGH